MLCVNNLRKSMEHFREIRRVIKKKAEVFSQSFCVSPGPRLFPLFLTSTANVSY